MIDLYRLEDQLRADREEQRRSDAQRAAWAEHVAGEDEGPRPRGWRRRLARALLALADRMQPRILVTGPHTPACSAMNGTRRPA